MYLINNVHAATSGIQLPIPLKPATSSNLFINRLEEAAGFRGSSSWIPEAAAYTLLIRYIRENFKIATFSRLSGILQFGEDYNYGPDGDFKNVPECTGVVNVALGPYPNGTSEIKITTKSEFYSHFVK